VRGLSVDEALIDGEAVVLRDDGRTDFGALMTKRGGAQASLVACRRLMTIPGVRQPTALAFVAAIDDPRASADREMSAPIWAWFPTASVGRGRLRQRHLEMRGQAHAKQPFQNQSKRPVQGFRLSCSSPCITSRASVGETPNSCSVASLGKIL
jgi:hypothetical protein